MIAPSTSSELEDRGCALAVHYREPPNLEKIIHLRLARLVSVALAAFEVLDDEHAVEIKVEHEQSTAIAGQFSRPARHAKEGHNV